MGELLVGYARVSSERQDAFSPHEGLLALGVEPHLPRSRPDRHDPVGRLLFNIVEMVDGPAQV
jgi:hypothetical protein